MATDGEDAAIAAMMRDAVISTNKEIAASVFDQDDLVHDETGDRSLETMGDGLEGQHEPEEDEPEAGEGEETSQEGAEGKDATDPKDDLKAKDGKDADPKAGDRQDQKAFVPPGRLREQTELARAAQAERDAIKAERDAERAQSQKDIAELKAAMALLQRQQQVTQPKPAEVEKPKIPDILEDPIGYAEYVSRQVEERVARTEKAANDRYLNASMDSARARHGETFDAAWKAVTSLNPAEPENKALVQRILAQPNPGDALVSWHKRQETLREVGEDPAAFKARAQAEERERLKSDPEFRRQFLAELRGEAEGSLNANGRPRNKIELPPSIQRAAGGNGRSPNDFEHFDGSEQAIANSVWT